MIPISVCIITKNEAEHLEKCLAALQPYPFEIVVVDTGSTDNSKEIALRYTSQVFDFEWINDFSAARNFSIDCASHNTILVLDTDEFITEIDLVQLDKLIKENERAVGCIKRLDYFVDDNNENRRQIYSPERLFNRKYYHYEHIIHEILVPTTNQITTKDYYDVPITADHVGYIGDKEKLYDKGMRDIQLLLKEVEQEPENPYYYFQLGQSYLLMKDQKKACEYFEITMKYNPSPKEDYTRIWAANYGNILIDSGWPEKALPLLSLYDDLSNNADYLCMIGSMYLHLSQPLKALSEFVKALTAPVRDSIEPKVISYYIGFVYELFQKKEIARTHYQSCGDYAPALEALARLDQ